MTDSQATGSIMAGRHLGLDPSAIMLGSPVRTLASGHRHYPISLNSRLQILTKKMALEAPPSSATTRAII